VDEDVWDEIEQEVEHDLPGGKRQPVDNNTLEAVAVVDKEQKAKDGPHHEKVQWAPLLLKKLPDI
jgi:hypothetical protein